MKKHKSYDIVIYMNEEDFHHKTSPGVLAYWEMRRAPQFFTENNKIFIACKGNVMGFVECDEFDPEFDAETLRWEADTFTYIVSVPCKQFRGFRYRWFDYVIEKGSRK